MSGSEQICPNCGRNLMFNGYGRAWIMQACPGCGWRQQHEPDTGVSLRDFFAAQSIKGCCPGSKVDQQHVDMLAEGAYRMADAMIAEREK